MNLRAMNSLYHEKGNGLFQKKSTPPADGRHVFFTAPLHHNFQNCLSPPPLRISIKLLVTVILIYTQRRRILLGTKMIFLCNKSQFSVISVFVVKVKITFSHLLKKAYTFRK